MGSLITFLAEKNDTHGNFALVEALMKPGNEPPPHVHEHEDEFFYVLEGNMDAYVGQEVFQVGPGEWLSCPRRKPHAWVIRSLRLRMLIFISPAGFEQYFQALSTPAGALELPSNAITYSQGTPEEAVRLGKELGVHFLSPSEIAEQIPAFNRMAA